MLLLQFTALLIGLVYSATSTTSFYSVQNLHGLLFVIVSEIIFSHMYNVMYTFPEECAVCMREKHLYTSVTYFTSKLLLTVSTNHKLQIIQLHISDTSLCRSANSLCDRHSPILQLHPKPPTVPANLLRCGCGCYMCDEPG